MASLTLVIQLYWWKVTDCIEKIGEQLMIMDPCIPLPIPDDQLDDLVEKAKDFALMHGE